MKQYSKPVVELEKFDLDAQFTACGVVPEDIKKQFEAQFASFERLLYENTDIDNARELLNSILYFNGGRSDFPFKTEEELWESRKTDEGRSAFDNYIMSLITHSADDPTSFYCYFAYAAAQGKDFS